MENGTHTASTEELVRARLFAMQDLSYRAFHSKLIPNVSPELIIGIRTPQLRAYARELSQDPAAAEYMSILPHTYYEENNLHAMLIEGIGDYEKTVAALNVFLSCVDNWATCDLIRPKVFKRHSAELLAQIKGWLASDHIYTKRFALEMLMVHYLDREFQPYYLDLAADMDDEDYYLRMMVAWFFATALAKQYDAALPYLENQRLPLWTHNKTIQKAIESFRISTEQKTYLRSLRRRIR